ncbi:MAG: hypothetical protein KIT14_21905 [bacterium]|nr:hypothetical protein [bacterium]
MPARRLLPVLLVLLVVASGCIRGAKAAPAGGALRANVERVLLHDGAIELTLEIPIDGSHRRRPVVLGIPGMRAPVLQAGAIWGDYTIQWTRLKDAPPPAPTEHTVGTFVLTSASAAVLGRKYLETISRTAWEFVPEILDHLTARDDVDPGRIALGGASTNGFAALQAASREKRLAAVGVFLACGDYLTFLQDSSMGMAGKPLALDPAYADWIRTQEVIRFPDALPPTPILLTGRVGDPLIPIGCVDTTAQVLTDAYLRAGVPDRFTFDRFELEGHGYNVDEQNAYDAFLRRWILN